MDRELSRILFLSGVKNPATPPPVQPPKKPLAETRKEPPKNVLLEAMKIVAEAEHSRFHVKSGINRTAEVRGVIKSILRDLNDPEMTMDLDEEALEVARSACISAMQALNRAEALAEKANGSKTRSLKEWSMADIQEADPDAEIEDEDEFGDDEDGWSGNIVPADPDAQVDDDFEDDLDDGDGWSPDDIQPSDPAVAADDLDEWTPDDAEMADEIPGDLADNEDIAAWKSDLKDCVAEISDPNFMNGLNQKYLGIAIGHIKSVIDALDKACI